VGVADIEADQSLFLTIEATLGHKVSETDKVGSG
jgi:hypothetical protein